MTNGPNHRLGCAGGSFRYSGIGYNRVRVCWCGAEDHDPEPVPPIDDRDAELADLRAYRERTEAALRDLCRLRVTRVGPVYFDAKDLRDRGLWREPGEAKPC